MTERVRLPEPTRITTKQNNVEVVAPRGLMTYLHSLIRILKFNFNDVNTRLSAIEQDTEVILISPDGTEWLLTVDDSGNLTTTST